MNIMRGLVDIFEQTSMDEAYMDVSKRCKTYDDAKLIASKLKEALKEREGLSVSVGISPSKSISKMASDMQKPDGLTAVQPEEVDKFLERLPVNRISGVGKKTTEFLHEKGIEIIGQLRGVEAKKLTDWFGKGGVWLWAIANGIEETPVEQRRVPTSFSVKQRVGRA